MPTNSELEERIEELELERERLLSEIDQERIELDGRMARSEMHAEHLQGIVTALTSGQQSLSEIYQEKEQLLLARVSAESRKMAAVHARWTDERAELEDEAKQLRKNLDEASRREAAAMREVGEYRDELRHLTATPPDREKIHTRELEEKQKIIDQLVRQCQKLEAQSAAQPLPEPTVVEELQTMLRNNPGIYVLTISSAMALSFLYLILRLILPSIR